MTAYLNHMRGMAEEELARIESDKDTMDDLLQFNETLKLASFFTCFDNMCKIAFRSKILNFNDHNKPIVDRECFDVYSNLYHRETLCHFTV